MAWRKASRMAKFVHSFTLPHGDHSDRYGLDILAQCTTLEPGLPVVVHSQDHLAHTGKSSTKYVTARCLQAGKPAVAAGNSDLPTR